MTDLQNFKIKNCNKQSKNARVSQNLRIRMYDWSVIREEEPQSVHADWLNWNDWWPQQLREALVFFRLLYMNICSRPVMPIPGTSFGTL